MQVPADALQSRVVESITKTAKHFQLECEIDTRRGFVNDIVDVILARQGKKAFAVITYEAAINATTDDSDRRKAFGQALERLETNPSEVLLVTSFGCKWAPLEEGFAGFESPDEWIRYEDLAAIEEGDRYAERLRLR